ncbi:hypothetical protein RFI_32693, partial [Reticulomyxa filosa]
MKLKKFLHLHKKREETKKVLIMLILQAEETEKSSKTLSLEGYLKNLQCLLCSQIANNAMELTCDEHEEQEGTLVIGEQCLMKYLKENNNKCPIGKHGTCNYVKGRTARKYICDLKVICPRQFMKHSNQKEENETKEGDISMEDGCAFKGKISEVKEHLENACSMKTLECKFKEFGCDEILCGSNLEEHMELQMKKHLDLLSDYIASFQNKIKQSQLNETNQT